MKKEESFSNYKYKTELTLKFSISRSSPTSRVKTLSESVATVTFISVHSVAQSNIECISGKETGGEMIFCRIFWQSLATSRDGRYGPGAESASLSLSLQHFVVGLVCAS